MFELVKKRTYPIGIDISQDSLRLAQLGDNGRGLKLIAGNSHERPGDIKGASSAWQRWAIETIHLLASYGGFRGKGVIATLPTSDIFIDHIKMPKAESGKLEDAIFSKIKQKLPFEPLQKNTMIKYIPAEQDNVLVLAAERRLIDRHLAIYEEAGLAIKSICIWPMALANCYTRFFGRRKSDLESVVMLACIEQNYTNVLICRHKNPLFARTISMGSEQFDDEKIVTRLVLELNTCKRQFGMLYRNVRVERLIFLSGQSVDKNICVTIAKQMEMPAQIGDCLAAVQIPGTPRWSLNNENNKKDLAGPVERRESQINWSVAFGLSLS